MTFLGKFEKNPVAVTESRSSGNGSFLFKEFVLLFENVTLLGNCGNGKLSICHHQRKIITECETMALKRSSVTCLTEAIG